MYTLLWFRQKNNSLVGRIVGSISSIKEVYTALKIVTGKYGYNYKFYDEWCEEITEEGLLKDLFGYE
jgi:hypothetical protein